MAEVSSFQDLALHGLKDIYDAEKQALAAYTELIEAASSRGLKDSFRQHERQTQGQVQRLEQIFQNMNAQSDGVTCKAVAGLIAEARENIKEVEAGPLRDAALIAAAQKLEHYEISAYGTAVTFAGHLGDQSAVSLLSATLDEEKQTDQLLTQLAEGNVNHQAEQQ